MTRCLIVGFALLVGCGQAERVDEGRGSRGDSNARVAARPATGDSAVRGDSGQRRDTAAVGDTALPEEPPCFASHLGLPCQ